MRMRPEMTIWTWFNILASTATLSTVSLGFDLRVMVVSKCNNRCGCHGWNGPFIHNVALAEPFTTLTNIQQQLLLQFPDIPVSVPTTLRQRLLPCRAIWTQPSGDNRKKRVVCTVTDQTLNHERLIYINESGCNLYTRTTKARALVGEHVRREACPRAFWLLTKQWAWCIISLNQFTITRAQRVSRSCQQLDCANGWFVPWRGHHSHCVRRCAPTSDIVIPEQQHGCFVLHMLPPCSPFLNPVE